LNVEPPASLDARPPAAPAKTAAPVDDDDAPHVSPEGPASSKLDRFKSEAGRRREVDSRESEAEVQQDGLLELLTFVIAGEHYAVDIERIVEIVTPRAVTRIPNADPSVVGILSLRGTIVTLVDVRGKLRHSAAGSDTNETRIVVIDFRNEIVGFVVDRVLRVVKTDAATIEPHPVVHANELDAAIRGVFRSGSALTILLDLDKLLDHNSLAGSTV
jgi:purine-binding chemotaxis protein CheW